MCVEDELGEGSLMSKVYNSAYNFNKTCYRRTRTRKFNLNMSWYKNLYRRTKRIEHLWTFYHNPLEGMLNMFVVHNSVAVVSCWQKYVH